MIDILQDFRDALAKAKPDQTIPAWLFAASVMPSGVTVYAPKEIADRFLGGLDLAVGKSAIGERTIEIILNDESHYKPHAVTREKGLFLPVRKMQMPWPKTMRTTTIENIDFYTKREATKVLLKRDGGVYLHLGK